MLKCRQGSVSRPQRSATGLCSLPCGAPLRGICTCPNWRASVCLLFFFFLNYSWFIIVLFIFRLNYKPKLHHRISAPRTLLPADLMAFCPWASAATLGPRDMETSTLTGKPRGLGAGLRESCPHSMAQCPLLLCPSPSRAVLPFPTPSLNYPYSLARFSICPAVAHLLLSLARHSLPLPVFRRMLFLNAPQFAALAPRPHFLHGPSSLAVAPCHPSCLAS